MSLIKWEPFVPMNDFFEDFSKGNLFKMSTDFAVDVYEKDSKIIAEINLPGINTEDINVSIEDNYLRVRVEHKEEKEDTGKHYYSKEIRRGSFEKVISLPANVKEESAEAEYHNGRLYITMDKLSGEKNKKIEIKIKK